MAGRGLPARASVCLSVACAPHPCKSPPLGGLCPQLHGTSALFLPPLQVDSELYRERNIRPSFGLGAGLYGGLAYSALDAYLLKGPLQPRWTFRHRWGLVH